VKSCYLTIEMFASGAISFARRNPGKFCLGVGRRKLFRNGWPNFPNEILFKPNHRNALTNLLMFCFLLQAGSTRDTIIVSCTCTRWRMLELVQLRATARYFSGILLISVANGKRLYDLKVHCSFDFTILRNTRNGSSACGEVCIVSSMASLVQRNSKGILEDLFLS
jgi:hypothetical protein